MVKFYQKNFQYEYPFPAVTLAYFLRYPNPYATHVLSTDVISREFDPVSQRLTTTRLHLKRSKIPPAILKILPKNFLGRTGDSGQSFILERSTIDSGEGWMETESRNLEWTGILSVIERQSYKRPQYAPGLASAKTKIDLVEANRAEQTDVSTSVRLLSRFGQGRSLRSPHTSEGSQTASDSDDDLKVDAPVKQGFFTSWSAAPMQRSIEIIGLRRAREALSKSTKGMNVVLERLRHGGLVQALEGMQQDRQRVFGADGSWRQSRWQEGSGDDS